MRVSEIRPFINSVYFIYCCSDIGIQKYPWPTLNYARFSECGCKNAFKKESLKTTLEHFNDLDSADHKSKKA